MNSYNGSQDEKLWSEDERPNKHPQPIGQIKPKGFFRVAVEEVCGWEGVEESYQHPVHELEGRQLGGKISIDTESMSMFWKLFFKHA